MSFLVSTQTLSQAWEDAQNIARAMSAGAAAQKDASLTGPVAGSRILSFERELRGYRDRLDAISTLSGIAAYVSGLPNTPAGYNVTTEFNNMRTQLLAVIQWIRDNFPKDATNTYLLERSWGADGPVERTFTTAQLANYRTQLDALVVAIG
jgi:hypothetical protein